MYVNTFRGNYDLQGCSTWHRPPSSSSWFSTPSTSRVYLQGLMIFVSTQRLGMVVKNWYDDGVKCGIQKGLFDKKTCFFFVIAHKLYIDIKEICRNRNILSKPSPKSNLDIRESNDFRDSVRLRHVNCKTIHSLGSRLSRTDQWGWEWKPSQAWEGFVRF